MNRKIKSSYTPFRHCFSGTIDRFAWEHPEFDIIQREFLFSDISSIDSYDPFISIILAGTSDIRNANWSAHEFRRDTLCALLTKTHPLSNSSSIAFEELKQHPLIWRKTEPAFVHMWIKHLKHMDVLQLWPENQIIPFWQRI